MAKTKIVPNEQKLQELILYLAEKCETDPTFGAVKLNKLLYYIDFHQYLRTGRPVTGVEYMRLEMGPVPRRLVPVRDEMKRRGLIAVQEKGLWNAPRAQQRIVALRPANLDLFSASEIAWADTVISAFWEQTGDDVSVLTHLSAGWRAMGLRETIPYEAVFVSDEPPTDYEKRHGLQLAHRHQWPV